MKKLMATMMAVVLSVCLLAGCGGSSGGSSGGNSGSGGGEAAAATDSKETADVTVTVWGPQEDQSDDNGKWLQTQCEAFAAAHPEWPRQFLRQDPALRLFCLSGRLEWEESSLPQETAAVI